MQLCVSPSGAVASKAAQRSVRHLWVKVRHGVAPVELPTSKCRNVSELLKNVMEVHKQTLLSVDLCDLQLYENEAAVRQGQAFKLNLAVGSVKGGNDPEDPLYVHDRTTQEAFWG